MTAIDSPQRYNEVAAAFAERYARGVLKLLHDHGLVSSDAIRAKDPAAVDLIFELAFSQLAMFEDHGGFEQGGCRFFMNPLISSALETPCEYAAMASRTGLHGALEDPLLERVFAGFFDQ